MKEKYADVIEKPTGVLLYSLASSSVKEDWQIKLVTEYIADKKLSSSIQLTGKVHAPWSKVFEGLNWDISCSISLQCTCHPTISTSCSLFLLFFPCSVFLVSLFHFPFLLPLHLIVGQVVSWSADQSVYLSVYPTIHQSGHLSVSQPVSKKM